MDFGLRWGRRKTLRVVKVKDQSQSTVVKDDRISNLPESLLCHILSFLTTKEAIVTSILSSRWKPLWTFLPRLNFDSIEFEGISSSGKEQIPNQQHCHHDQLNRFTFAHIVFWVLALRNRNNVNPLKHSRLYWRSDGSDPIHVKTWLHTLLHTLLSHDLEELDLHIGFPQFYIFPSTLFNHVKTLVVLKLKGNIVLDPPSSSALLCFPSLKILHLENVHYAKHDSILRLLSCCPVLQNLSVEIYEWGYSSMKIIVPTLKRLRLCYSLTLPKHNELEINAPALEYLYFSGNTRINVLFGNLSNLVEADIGVHLTNSQDYGNRIRDFIKSLSNVKSLHLDSYSAECLCKATEFDLPMFHNLAFLYFHGGTCLWNVLPHLLHRAPNLAVLVFHKEKEFFICDRKDSSIIERMIYEDVPKCISLHLKTFHFKGFKGLTYQLEFVRHILKTARFLETMTVSSAHMNSKEKVRVLKELLMFPKGIQDLSNCISLKYISL